MTTTSKNIAEITAKKDQEKSSGPISKSSKNYEFIKFSNCTVLPENTSENNCFIVMGNVGAGPMGYGNTGVKSTGNIVLGVGVKATPKELPTPQILEFSPNFYHDSAVIYISEQCDIDSDFKYGGTKKSFDSSAIALKADELRMFSRGEIKLVTGMDKTTSPISDAPSHKNRDNVGVSIVANNDTRSLQYMVKGNNLVLLLTEILNEIEQAYSQVTQFITLQKDINEAVMSHTHMSDFTTAPLARGTDPLMSMTLQEKNDLLGDVLDTIMTRRAPNIGNLKNNFLTLNSAKYINSRFNKVN